MTRDEANKLAQEVINADKAKMTEYVNEAVDRLLARISQAASEGKFIYRLDHDDLFFTKHVSLHQNRSKVIEAALCILANKYGYIISRDSQAMKNSIKIIWGDPNA